jgi:hypothetical protein
LLLVLPWFDSPAMSQVLEDDETEGGIFGPLTVVKLKPRPPRQFMPECADSMELRDKGISTRACRSNECSLWQFEDDAGHQSIKRKPAGRC